MFASFMDNILTGCNFFLILQFYKTMLCIVAGTNDINVVQHLGK